LTINTPTLTYVGFTGTRKGMTWQQRRRIHDYLEELAVVQPGSEFHHGDAVGADEQAAGMAYALRYWVVCHPPKRNTYRAYTTLNHVTLPEEDYLVRNKAIVDATSVLLATPDGPERVRSGTWQAIRYARSLGDRYMVVVYPDGKVHRVTGR